MKKRLQQKCRRRQMLLHYYSLKEIEEFLKIPKAAVLDWLEEVNRFLYKLDPLKWKRDQAHMQKIGW